MQDADADFFALGGHSLLAMKLAAQLSRQFARQVTPGQVMVASTVAKLATIIDGEEAAPSAWDSKPFCRCVKVMARRCFVSIRHPVLPGSSACSRYLDPQWSIIGIQSPRPHGPMQTAASQDEVCEAHLATLLEQQPHGPYYLLGYSLGGTLAQGIAARLRARGEQVAFLGLLDTWPPETQNWQEKRSQWSGPEVLAEINREREASWRHSREVPTELFTTIEGNYADAVRLLTTAHSVAFDGKATLFVAERTLQEGMTPEQAWAPWIAELDIYRQDCAHVDIISPVAFEKLGRLFVRR